MSKKYKPTEKEVMEFLKESNAIEGVYDADSLKQAKKAWDFLVTSPKLDTRTVLMTHQILMKNQKHLRPDQIGFFRRQPVWIGGREGIHFLKIQDAMDEWFLDVETSLEFPGIGGKHFRMDHITYERIHPFVDGNGRTGRMFMNWEYVQAGMPLEIIHEGDEQYEYYKWFNKDGGATYVPEKKEDERYE